MEHLQKIAVLIDADNTQLSKLEAMLREISTYGRIVVKRAYGNWKKDVLKRWEDELKRLAIKAEQQFDYVVGKNATDMALVISAVDLLHTGVYDAFVLVSSDSDYTPLAIRLHESGVYVIGVGENKTPEAFRNSCDDFIFLENLSKAAAKAKESEEYPALSFTFQETKEMVPALAKIDEIHDLLALACDKYQDADGFAYVSAAGDFIKRAKPDFDSRTYGYAKLTDLLAAYPKRYKVKRSPGKGIAYKCIS